MHGLYNDDYSEKAWAFDFARASWKLNLRPLSHIRSIAHILIANLSNAIPRHEFTLRITVLAIHFLNVVLLGKLARRLTQSFFVGIIASAYFAFPIVASDAVLWFSNSIANTISLCLLLIGFHCLLSCRSLRNNFILFASGVGSWILMVFFYEPGLFTILLLPLFAGMAYPGRTQLNRKISILGLAGSYFPIGMYMVFVERRAPEFADRGGATLNLAFIFSHRVPDVFRALVWLLTDWGLNGPLREAFKIGSHEWLGGPLGWVLILGFLVSLLFVVLLFPANQEPLPSSDRLIRLLFIASAWTLLTMVPTILVKSQEVSTRALYIPFAGFAMGAAAISGMIVNISSRCRKVFWPDRRVLDGNLSTRTLLSLSGLLVLLCSFTMAGLTRAYQLRWYLDESQIEALGPVMARLSRVEPVWLFPVTLDEKTVGESGGSQGKLDMYLDGVFETPWAARDGVRLAFGDRNVQALTFNRWEKVHVTSVDTKGGQTTTVTIRGSAIPIEHLLAFTYQHGHLILLSPLEITGSDGISSTTIYLPLATQVARGIETRSFHFQMDRSN